MINKKIYLGMAFLVIALFLIGNLSAFAVSSQYWREKPVMLYPGTTTEIHVALQNMGGEEAITVTGTIIEGSEIATLSDPSNVYTVPVGTRLNVNITFNVPEDTAIPSNYSIVLSFVTTTGGAETLGLGSAIQKTIPVFIIKEPRKQIELKSSPWSYIILALIVILIVVITIVLKRKKKK